MRLPYEFEQICVTDTAQVTRAKVPGGWIVYTIVNSPRGSTSLTSDFISDPEWEWEIK